MPKELSLDEWVQRTLKEAEAEAIQKERERTIKIVKNANYKLGKWYSNGVLTYSEFDKLTEAIIDIIIDDIIDKPKDTNPEVSIPKEEDDNKCDYCKESTKYFIIYNKKKIWYCPDCMFYEGI